MGIRYLTPSGNAGAVPELTVSPLVERSGLRVAGEIGLATHEVWERALERVVRESEEGAYYLELSSVTFVDVAGTCALAAAARRMGDGRRIVLDRPPTTLQRVLEMFWPDLSEIEVSMS